MSAPTKYRGKKLNTKVCVFGLYPHIRPVLLPAARSPRQRGRPPLYLLRSHHLVREAFVNYTSSETQICVLFKGFHSIAPFTPMALRHAWKFPSHFQTPTRVVTYCEKAVAVVELRGRHLVTEAVAPYTSCGAVTSLERPSSLLLLQKLMSAWFTGSSPRKRGRRPLY